MEKTFKINHKYSSSTILKLEKIKAKGQFIGGVHTLENNQYKFELLTKGAYRGTGSYFYKLINIY
jgi:hypothetical protein